MIVLLTVVWFWDSSILAWGFILSGIGRMGGMVTWQQPTGFSDLDWKEQGENGMDGGGLNFW